MQIPKDIADALIAHFKQSKEPVKLGYTDKETGKAILITVQETNAAGLVDVKKDWLLQEPARCSKCGR
jgi:hypothetical protein